MKLFLLTVLAMVAFAANSVLNRFALAEGAIGPSGFAVIRLLSGALALWLMVSLRNRAVALPSRSATGAISLALYVLGFSFAYVSLPAGPGALVLFGGVQMTMFAGALIKGEHVPPARWAGALVAFAGLAYLLWPSEGQSLSMVGAILMGAAAIGWGIYSLYGRGVKDPLAATAGNFVWALPFGALIYVLYPDQLPVTISGVVFAVVSGVVTSGLGYALWYSVLPRLEASVAAVSQLTVPIIATVGGAALLGEAVSLELVIASILVLGGVALSLKR
ncbi:DMT family transporter [Cochlodiniinecator piscidefendens]|uniref:DMT family transporter n=1 Tax=Cochlodiniinecator piscidefendens TaxID=2715756 RepID=UPI00140B020F|nr:DMT family transporter [Cochlodiniinecator piscidefendens]